MLPPHLGSLCTVRTKLAAGGGGWTGSAGTGAAGAAEDGAAVEHEVVVRDDGTAVFPDRARTARCEEEGIADAAACAPLDHTAHRSAGGRKRPIAPDCKRGELVIAVHQVQKLRLRIGDHGDRALRIAAGGGAPFTAVVTMGVESATAKRTCSKRIHRRSLSVSASSSACGTIGCLTAAWLCPVVPNATDSTGQAIEIKDQKVPMMHS